MLDLYIVQIKMQHCMIWMLSGKLCIFGEKNVCIFGPVVENQSGKPQFIRTCSLICVADYDLLVSGPPFDVKT